MLQKAVLSTKSDEPVGHNRLYFFYTVYEAYLSVLAEIATIPSGHCSEEKLDAYSSVS